MQWKDKTIWFKTQRKIKSYISLNTYLCKSNHKNLDLSIYKHNFFKRSVFTLGQRHQNCWFTLLIAGSNNNPSESLNVFRKKTNHFEGDECEGRCSVELNYGTMSATSALLSLAISICSCAEDGIQIGPQKQCHSAFGHNSDTVVHPT